MQLFQLVFVSSFVDAYGYDLNSLLHLSSLGNEHSDVKGMTLFANGNILQLLQGEPSAVQRVYGILPSQSKQFQVIKMTEEFVVGAALQESCMGLDAQGFKTLAKEPMPIPIFRLSAAAISQRIGHSMGCDLALQFVELHS